MPKHKTVQEDERVHPVMENYRMSCCDCGLVHTLNFRAVKVRSYNPDGTWNYVELDPRRVRVVFTASRNNRATAQIRRWRKNHDQHRTASN